MKRVVCFVIIAVFGCKSFAQKKIFLDLGAGLTSHVMLDDAMSPVRYTGLLPTLAPGLIKEKKGRKFVELRFPLQYGNIHSHQFRNYPTMKGPLGRLDIDYVHLRHTRIISDSANGNLLLGAAFHSMISFRYMQQLDNSAIIYDFFNSIAIAVAYRRSFLFKERHFTHYHRLSVPIISAGTRPDYMNLYNVIEPGGNDPLSDAFERMKIRSFGSFQRVILRNSLFYNIQAGNMLAFTYEWQYYGADFTVPVRSAYHSFIFSLLVRI